MKHILKIIPYFIIFFLTFSIGYVIVLKFIPITVTPLKVIRFYSGIADGNLSVKSKWKSIDKINLNVAQAVVASEDNNFMIHSGIDYDAVKQAWKEYKRGGKMRGASTISQQTAKNIFCTHSKTWFRKGVETYFTILIEFMWSKKDIMEAYLNIIETGKGVYGVESAAREFFNKNADELNLHEASMIATVLPNPRKMNLAKPSDYMVRRSQRIRNIMRSLPKVDLNTR